MIELYQAEGCPHCAKVRDALTELGQSFVAHNPRLPAKDGGDARNRQVLEELRAVGGEDKIPFLVDHNHRVTLYESDVIVDYLDEHYG